MTTSIALFSARALVDELVRGGVAAACVAPGSRSTALALAVAERDDLSTHVMTDERSMGFFALGLARASRRAVIVVCTSGTAAANLVPAACEAALGGGAIVLLTADRPPELQDCAAPQTIDQAGLFGSHARWAAEVPILDATPESARVLRSLAARAISLATQGSGGPVHLNVPLREPFVDDSFPARRSAAEHARQYSTVGARDDGRPFTQVLGTPALRDGDVRELAERFGRARRGVVVAAGTGLPAAAIAGLARALGWPILADPMSGLRFGPHDRSQVVDAIEPLLRDETLRSELRPDAIVRFGLTPAPRSVQRWLEEAWPAEHVVVADAAWPDPVRTASTVVRADAAGFCRTLAAACSPAPGMGEWRDRWLAASAAARIALEESLASPAALFDGVVLRSLVAALPEGATLVVGNSMPVRDAEAFLAAGERELCVMANRGASGIDGVLSTALGIAAAARGSTALDIAVASRGSTALVVGDLSFLHDSAALAFAAREHIPLLLVVVNNDGGGIFSYLPLREALADSATGEAVFERFFGTPHGADLASVASVTGGFFARVEDRTSLDAALAAGLAAAASGPAVVEVRTDREAGRLAHLDAVQAAQTAARAAVRGETDLSRRTA